ncbi:MAG TPA: class I SAM-dependent methyltransferase [Gemmatimonadaceae bacterium]|nr:class I SAM-dependent methyltransferase [Gemmatimonadaceae bacterium]
MAQPETLPKGDYVLGTQDVEIDRLGLQHLVWRPRASDAWRRAGFTVGQHLLDVGCGPGYATLDLAAIVGASGRITAIDRSPKFLEVLRARLEQASVRNVETIELDLDRGALPKLGAEGAWCRWVFAFLNRPRDLLTAIHGALAPGATLVVHEYFNYASWRLAPRQPGFEEFVQLVMSSWRKSGGEPDIAIELLSWLPQEGFAIRELRPIVDVVGPGDFIWQWPSTFVDVGLARLAELGYLPAGRAEEIRQIFRRVESNADTRMVTPGVLEIVATRL